MECPEEGSAVVVRGEVGPDGHAGIQFYGGSELHASGKREDEITKERGRSFEARVKLVENACPEGTATRNSGIVRTDQLS